jgi:hypothetical protein
MLGILVRGICLYQQAAIFCIDESNELLLQFKDGKVFVYLTNKSTKCDISPDIASTVQECLTLTMTKVLEFYHKSFGKSLSTFEVSKAFKLEVGEWCTSGEGCYILQPKDATHLIHQYKELQLDDTNKYLLLFSVKAKHSLQHQLT